MCIAQNSMDPRLRHRAAYLAPTRFHPEIRNGETLHFERLLPFDDDNDNNTPPRNEDRRKYGKMRYDTFLLVYQSLVDFVVLLLVACMSLFFYNVEISIVKMANQQHPSNILQGSRIVWRNETSTSPIATTRRRSFEDTIV
jgi:hypothetical protein